MAGRLNGKVAFITGAARGQGRSHAVRMAREGADIIAIDICAQVESVPFPMATPADLAETVEQVEKLGRRIVALTADVRDFTAVEDAVNRGVADFGRLDIVCTNAGIAGSGALHELSEDSWRDMIDTNLTGVWHSLKATVPHLIAGQRGGAVVLTSSVAGLKPYANIAHYVAAKHGVVGLMGVLALELGPHNIRVNSVHPTNVNTEMFHNSETYRLFAPELSEEQRTVDVIRTRASGIHALPVAWIESEDVTNAVMFLISDEARYITGTALRVDAGSITK